MASLTPVTFEVAGLACRIECDWAKPLLWISEVHPAFRCTRTADLVVDVTYDDSYWTRGLPLIAPDQLVDAPVHTTEADRAVIRTSYYEARIHHRKARVSVRIAGGFQVGGLFRALYGALLPRRRACLIRAAVYPRADGAVLACGASDGGVVALVDDGGSIMVDPTPFHDGTTAQRPPRYRVDAIAGADAGAGSAQVAAAARVLEHVIVVDHSAPTVHQVLDLVTRLAATVPAVPWIAGVQPSCVAG